MNSIDRPDLNWFEPASEDNGWSKEQIDESNKLVTKAIEFADDVDDGLDIAVLPDNDSRVPLNVLYARREQLEDLYYEYGDTNVFNSICNITGFINAREESYEY